jgi:hypothetical protein
VSDFISRIAARAVGTPPLARPRLPTFFANAAAADDAGDVQEGVVAPTAPQVQAQAEVPPHEPPFEPKPDVESPTPGSPEEHIEVAAQASRDSVLVRERATIHQREIAVHVEPPPEERHELIPQPRATVAVQATPVVLEPERAAAVPAPAARAEEVPSVRVHIGRLEVRANLQQAPPQRARRAEPRAPELSLSDYLRGKREAG